MDAEILYHYVDNLAALLAIVAKKVHIGESDARQVVQGTRLKRRQAVRRHGHMLHKHALGHVEPRSWAEALAIGLHAQQCAEVIDEAQMEVCHRRSGIVEQDNRLLDVGK